MKFTYAKSNANQISAIKAYRAVTNMGLKESKDAIVKAIETGVLDVVNITAPPSEVVKSFAEEGVEIAEIGGDNKTLPSSHTMVSVHIEWDNNGCLRGLFPISKFAEIGEALQKILS
jgi:hypothetical protein